MRPEHIAVIGSDDEDRVLGQLARLKSIDDVAHAGIECCNVGIIAGQIAASRRLDVGRDVRPQFQVLRLEPIAEGLRGRVVGIVRRAPGDDQQERLLPMRKNVLLRSLRLGDGVVAFPVSFLIRVRVVGGMEVVVRALVGPPELETLRRSGGMNEERPWPSRCHLPM